MSRSPSLWMVALSGLVIAVVPGESQDWQSAAEWHRSFKKPVHGTLLLDENGVEFRSPKLMRRWSYLDVHSFDLSLQDLTLLTYESRPWHEPGERRYHFTLADTMPAEIAAQFTARVGKPVRNGAPIPNAQATAEIAAHHRIWAGGSMGTLRFKDDGIDYVAENGRDSRSWRWADIQTLSNPNPYEFRVTGYREIAEFDLKEPLSREMFERVWDRLYAVGLNLSPGHSQAHDEVHQ